MDIVRRFLGFDLVNVAGARVTVASALTAIAIFIVAILVARLVGRAMKRLRARSHGSTAALYVVEKLATYGVVVAGLTASLSALGLNLTSLAVFAGALGVGVGLGLQGVVKEFVSGLVLIFDQIVNIGDYIELPNGLRGVVLEIGPRATRICNNDNVDILVPNSKLIEEQIINWTMGGATRRIHVPFSVAYGCDKDEVRKVVAEAANAVDFTLPETPTRRTQVWLVGFGDSALNFELVVWPTLEAVKRPASMQAAYTWAIEDALRRAGIEIPFPQTDLRVRSLFGAEGDAAFAALGLTPERRRPPAPSARPASSNDAAADVFAPEPERPSPPPAPE